MRKSVADEMSDNINEVLEDVLNEFLDGEETTLLETDFDVELLKYSIAHKNGRISTEEMVCLTASLIDVEKIWRKLNDK